MNTENVSNEEKGNGVLADGSGSFNCYLCGYTYKSVVEPCIHYEESEIDTEDVVSLCDECNKKVMEKAKKENIEGLSSRFFNCH